jgi:glycosyltransferase involved in cell wall biosynthesis
VISIIAPTCNEEESIEDFLISLKKLKLRNFELIIVDDSTDRTAEIAKNLMKKLRIKGKVIKRVNKLGKGSAIRDGLKVAKGDYIVLIDADLQYNPFDIPRLLRKLKEFDLVNTIKLRKDPFYRKIFGKIFKILVFILFGLKIDTQSTLRAFRKKLKKIDLKTNGFAWDVEFLYKAKKLGYKICEIPILYGKREKGKSKVTLITPLNMFVEIVKIRSKVIQFVLKLKKKESPFNSIEYI